MGVSEQYVAGMWSSYLSFYYLWFTLNVSEVFQGPSRLTIVKKSICLIAWSPIRIQEFGCPFSCLFRFLRRSPVSYYQTRIVFGSVMNFKTILAAFISPPNTAQVIHDIPVLVTMCSANSWQNIIGHSGASVYSASHVNNDSLGLGGMRPPWDSKWYAHRVP